MSLADDIKKLSGKPPAEVRLDGASTPQSIRRKTGLSPVSPPSGSGNIASPLTETDYADREFFGDHTMTTTDGVFTFVWNPIKTTKFLDANDKAVVIEYKEPPP